jgi:alkyldihydroxyacetonephosphate synthase
MQLGPGEPTPPIALTGGAAAATARLATDVVEVGDDVVARLADACASVTTDLAETAEASRDWWPLAMTWATSGTVTQRAAVVARPTDADQVAAVASICNEARVPLTASAGRSGVCGNAVPVFGGVIVDLCGLSGILDVDDTSLVVDVAAGTFGDHFEDELRRDHRHTVGHWPQSMALSTVGGWVACRGAGQYSTRYGKIEDIVVGLDVVLADGRRIQTGGQPRQAVGPDLTQVFVGSEGTLGIVTSARLAMHPLPDHERRAAYAFDSFAAGLDACRRILRRGATPAVLRLYDEIESERSFSTGDEHCVLIVLDEGDPAVVDGMWTVVTDECAVAEALDTSLVEHWLERRNDVSQLEALIGRGFVVDTMEIAAPWARLDDIYVAALDAIRSIDGTLSASAHQSHAYIDGACLYFTFAGKADDRDAYYLAAWDAGTRAVLDHGGALSHHHGVGLNRSRFVADALGSGFEVLVAMKAALDPNGVLNPGKLGLPSPFGAVRFPS